MIKLKDFVDVNLTSIAPSSTEENKTVVYIYGSSVNEEKLDEYLNASNYESLKSSFDTNAQNFITQFFALGGASLRVICIVTDPATSQDVVNSNNDLFLAEISKLPMSQVALVVREASVITSAPYDSTGYQYGDISITVPEAGTVNGFSTLLTKIQNLVNDKGTAFRKLLVRGTYSILSTPYVETDITALTRDTNLIWKLCTNEKDLASVLAYFSKVTLTEPDSLRDYCFTEESTCTDMSTYLADITWSNIKSFVNVDVDLEQNGSIINLGGNTSAGYDMIQEFESIYISQRLVTKEMSLLKSKINLLNARSVIHSAIIDVLETYYNVNYLVQTQYNGANIYRNIGGKNICVLAKGEVITSGYKVIILPKVSTADVHSFPEIEIIINTNKGIRFIKTTGVVL